MIRVTTWFEERNGFSEYLQDEPVQKRHNKGKTHAAKAVPEKLSLGHSGDESGKGN